MRFMGSRIIWGETHGWVIQTERKILNIQDIFCGLGWSIFFGGASGGGGFDSIN